MSTDKQNYKKCFIDRFEKSANYFAKNYLRILSTALFLIITTLISAFVITLYCDIFYTFSDYAKDRVLKYRNLVFLTTPCFFWFSGFLCKKYAFNPFGAGLDNITFALKKLQKYPNNYQKVANFIGIKIAIVIFISSLISTFGGGSLGREAPSILIAVCIFFASASYLQKYLINIDLRNWIFVGYAIGISVAFNAPLSGIIYVFEKLFRNSSQRFFQIFKLIKSSNFILSILLSSIALIVVYFFMTNHDQIYFIKNFEYLSFNHLDRYLIITLICSALAYLLLTVSRYFYINFIKIENWFWHFIPVLFGLLVAFIALYYGIFSIGGGIHSVNESLMSDKIIYNSNDFIGRYFSTIFTYVSGNAGGLVAPSIALGNLIGNIYAELYNNINAKAIMLISMVAFLSPVLGVPLTSAMVIVESTRIAFDNFYILAIVALISFFTVLLVQKIGLKIRAKLFKTTTN